MNMSMSNKQKISISFHKSYKNVTIKKSHDYLASHLLVVINHMIQIATFWWDVVLA